MSGVCNQSVFGTVALALTGNYIENSCLFVETEGKDEDEVSFFQFDVGDGVIMDQLWHVCITIAGHTIDLLCTLNINNNTVPIIIIIIIIIILISSPRIAITLHY